MKVLVLGSGGREHALVWKLRQSPRVSKVYCATGNGGIAADAECLPVDLKSLDSITALAARLQPDLTIVGPELVLTLGVVDEFTTRGWPIFGPTRAAAQLETSKSFAKEFMQRHRIPTSHYAICDSADEVKEALGRFSTPVVVKADGLAAGKGVVISKSKDEAAAVAFEMLSQDQQPTVDEAMAPGADPAVLPERLKWRERGWPDFTLYRPLFDLARRYSLSIVALDLEPPTVRRIAKGGLGALPAGERSRFVSRLQPDADQERRLARDIDVAHCGLLPASAVPFMVDAWHARNVTMARRIVQALERAPHVVVPQVVVIVGRGHQASGGLPDQVATLRPDTRQLVVDLVERGSDETPTITQGRIVWPGPAVERPDPCAALRKR